MVEGDQTTEDRFLPDGETHPVAVLKGECVLLVRKTELLGLRPELDDVGRGDARTDDTDSRIQVVSAPLVGVYHGPRRAADREGAIVAGPVPVEALQDVEVRRVTGPQHPIRVD